MSATELDLPILASPEQIRRREFVTARRGYKPAQVRDFLERVAEQVDRMQTMLRQARIEAATASRAQVEPRPDPYERLAARFTETLRAVDERAEDIRAEAEREAGLVLEDARAEADRIRTDAVGHAEEARAAADATLREAKQNAANAIASLTGRRETLVEELGRMRERILAAADELGSLLDPVSEVAPMTSTRDKSSPERWALETSTPEMSVTHEQRGPASVQAPSVGIRYEDLWEGTEPLPLELPEIPPLDLTWDDLEED